MVMSILFLMWTFFYACIFCPFIHSSLSVWVSVRLSMWNFTTLTDWDVQMLLWRDFGPLFLDFANPFYSKYICSAKHSNGNCIKNAFRCKYSKKLLIKAEKRRKCFFGRFAFMHIHFQRLFSNENIYFCYS